MKKFVITIIIVNGLIWGLLSNIQAKANDYATTVIGHVVKNHNEIDHGKLLEQEMSKMGQFALQMVSILQQHLPYIMDNVMTELRLELDKTHKMPLT